MSKAEEISTIEIIEGAKVYEAMYIMGMEATMRLQPRPRCRVATRCYARAWRNEAGPLGSWTEE